MKKEDKLLGVLVEIVRNFMDNKRKDIETLEKNIVEGLIGKGYEMDEINDLLDSVFNMMNIDNQEFKLRLLTEEEMPNFSDEGRSYLIDLKNNLIINEEEFENAIIELSLQNPYNGVKDIKRYLMSKGINPDVIFS
ncbi:MAG: DUF494 family protein [Fusobacteriaceae bacterium]|jgi:SOS response regulatory protein OraA/RecX|nr:DUF494 family protein [Fusobacteriaceae bacterium]MBN2839205.1 DUF494 family protein [Fusobacteriaceae bacterium]